jgi:hypothetical protein
VRKGDRLRQPRRLADEHMVTLFTTPKPFVGHSAVIQRNALKSWTLLHPDVEVILFGDEEGAAETARELGIRHIPQVERTPEGTKVLRSFFDPAQRMARYELLCYVNCDIVLTPDFLKALSLVHSEHKQFLMVGRRWDIDVLEPLNFSESEWASRITNFAMQKGHQRSGGWIDYFAFSRGLYLEQLPIFVIGRVFWDQWLVWKARSAGVPLVDASAAVVAIHQNHGYGYHPAGRAGVWSDEQAMRNLELAGGKWHLCTIDDATHLLGFGGLRPNPHRLTQAVSRIGRTLLETVWWGVLDRTRNIRHSVGLRKKTAPAGEARTAANSVTESAFPLDKKC